MSKHPISADNSGVKRKRGAPWARAASERGPVDLGLVTREAIVVARVLRDSLGRDPTAHELAASLGIGIGAARKLFDGLAELPRLTEGMERCLVAIDTLEKRLGTSPTTREVSHEMGLTDSASRFHINRLARLGLVTPPQPVRVVLALTPWGRDLLPELPPPPPSDVQTTINAAAAAARRRLAKKGTR